MSSNPGSMYEDTFEFRIVDGVETLVKTGETNVFEKIQSFAESTDINVLIGRFLNGDQAALNQRQGEYLDVTNYPKTYAELYDRVKAAESVYFNLPDKVKEKYSTPKEFFEAYGTESFIDFAKAFEADSAASENNSGASGDNKE